jgi:hypothetical protein
MLNPEWRAEILASVETNRKIRKDADVVMDDESSLFVSR